jgi:hypothetical protein
MNEESPERPVGDVTATGPVVPERIPTPRDPEQRRRLTAALLGDARANDDARRFLIVSSALLAVVSVVFGTRLVVWLQVPVAYCLPTLLLYPLLLAWLLWLRGRAIVPRGLLVAGSALTIGGIVGDMLITVVKTPTLELERNPVARALLDSHHSVQFVYWYAIIAQGELAAVICILWAAFLRHRLTLLLSVRRDGSAGPLAVVKTALGGGSLTWRQFLFPLRLADLPSAYHVVWVFMAALMGTGLYRLYLVLCWLGACSFAHGDVAMAAASTFCVGCYLAWLATEAGKANSAVDEVV